MSQARNPWEHRRWRGGICTSGLGSKARINWYFVLLFGGVAVGLPHFVPDILHFSRVRWMVLFPAGAAALGFVCVISALIATARWFRFGRCVVSMSSVPGIIGGHFRGEILLPETFPRNTDVRMELVCERTTTTPGANSDSPDHVHVERDWTHTIRVATNAVVSRDHHCIVPFDFTIPYGLADETDCDWNAETQTRTMIQWNLRVFASLTGPDLDIKYHVPVFRTEQSDESVTGEVEDGKSVDEILRDTGEPRRVRIENVNSVPTYICDTKGMKKGLSFVPGVFGLVFLSATVFIARSSLPGLLKAVLAKDEGMRNLFKLIPLFIAFGALVGIVVFGLLGLLCLYLCLRDFVSRRTWIQNGMIHQRASLFGIPWKRSCPVSSITGINFRDGSSSNGKRYYDVVMERNTLSNFGRMDLLYLFCRVTVATSVATEGEAKDLSARLRHELGLPANAEGLS
jgi:hypothetical protein